jgi:Transposase DDE domain
MGCGGVGLGDHQHLLGRVQADPAVALVDSVAMPICRFAPRLPAAGGCGSWPPGGRDEVAKQTYLGLRAHLRVHWPGVIADGRLVAANVSDLAMAPELTQGVAPAPAPGPVWALADRNHGSPRLAEELHARGVALLASPRGRARTQQRQPAWVVGRRRRIETVIGQLTERYHLKRVWARDAWHLWSRWLRKLLSHTIAVWLSQQQGLPLLRFAHLVTPNPNTGIARRSGLAPSRLLCSRRRPAVPLAGLWSPLPDRAAPIRSRRRSPGQSAQSPTHPRPGSGSAPSCAHRLPGPATLDLPIAGQGTQPDIQPGATRCCCHARPRAAAPGRPGRTRGPAEILRPGRRPASGRPRPCRSSATRDSTVAGLAVRAITSCSMARVWLAIRSACQASAETAETISQPAHRAIEVAVRGSGPPRVGFGGPCPSRLRRSRPGRRSARRSRRRPRGRRRTQNDQPPSRTGGAPPRANSGRRRQDGSHTLGVSSLRGLVLAMLPGVATWP